MGETHVKEDLEQKTAKEEHPHTKERIVGMRKKVDLTDIILEKEKKTANKKKSLLLALASFILIFLVFLILSKMFNSSDEQNIITDEENISSKQIVLNKPETMDEEGEQPKATQETQGLSDTDLKFEEMVRKLRAEDAKENKTQIIQDDVKQPKPEIKQVVTPVIKTVKEDVQDVKKEIKQLTSPIKITESKPKVKKVVKHSPKVKRPVRGAFISDATGYFVQVGATTSPSPSKTLASKIRANGYSYQTHPIVVKGRKFYKILVGPYTTRIKAKEELKNIRATINPKAFLYHLR